MSRPGLHLQAFLMTVFSVVVYLTTPITLHTGGWTEEPHGVPIKEGYRQGDYIGFNLFINQIIQITGFIFSLLISRYLYLVIVVHWFRGREQRANMMRATSAAVSLIVSHYERHVRCTANTTTDMTWPADHHPGMNIKDPSSFSSLPSSSSSTSSSSPPPPPSSSSRSLSSTPLHHAGPAFGHRLRQLFRVAPHLAVHYLEGRSESATGRYLIEEDIISASAWTVIRQLYKHDRPIRIYREIMSLVRAAQQDTRHGALRSMSSDVMGETLTQINLANNAVNGMLSSVNPQKLPFPYVQLIQWATKLVVLAIIADLSIDVAEYSIHYRHELPFLCPAADQLTNACGTSSMIFLIFTTLFFA